MLTFLGFIALVIILFWVASLSNRITMLEKKMQSKTSIPDGALAGNKSYDVAQIHEPVSSVGHPAFSESLAKSKPAGTESILSEGLVTKIGVLALIIGIGFFIKYAIDQGWISQWTRIIMGLGLGSLLLWLGAIWKDKYKQYAGALSGGGLALMYFSVFAAYQFYHLLPQIVCLASMVIVSLLGVYVAYHRKSLGLALLATSGAYLSPLMLQSGMDQHTGLFLYLGLLNVTAIAILFTTYWNELLLLGFLGTVFDFSLWGFRFLEKSNTPEATFFACFIFLLFLIGGAAAFRKAMLSQRLPQTPEKFFAFFSILAGSFYVLAMPILLYNNFHDYLAILGLLGAVGTFIAYALVDRFEYKKLNHSLAGIGTVLLSLACIWQFQGKTTDFILIVLGVILMVSGVALRRAELRVWGLITLIACVFAVLITPYDMASYVFILNSKFGLILTEVAALWFGGWLFKQGELTPAESQASEIAHAIGSLLLWFGFSWELTVYFRDNSMENTRNLLLSLWWIAYGTALLVFGAMAKSVTYRKIAVAIFSLAILKVFLYDVLALEMGYRIVSFIVLGVILLSVSYAYQHNKEKITQFLAGEKLSK